ncbi:MAG: lytic transglycosylase domain-containing protein [bacterium]|nr:lytic transglycosylase domain-containing protein [bacterium]
MRICRIMIIAVFLLAGWWESTGMAATHIDKAREYAVCGLLDKAVGEYRAALEKDPTDESLRWEIAALEYRLLKNRLPVNSNLRPVDAISGFEDYRGAFAEWSGKVRCLLQSEPRLIYQLDIEDITVNLASALNYEELSPGRAVTVIVKIPYSPDKITPEVVAVTMQAPVRIIPVEDDVGALQLHAAQEDYEEYKPQEVIAANDPPVTRAPAINRQSVRTVRTVSRRSPASGSRHNNPPRTEQIGSEDFYIKAYAAAVKHFNTRLSMKDAENIADTVLRYSAQYDIDPRLIMAVLAVESSFNPMATSSAGAAGLGQLMPATAAGLGITDRYDPTQSIWGAVKILKGHMDKWSGKGKDLQHALALACYNAGPGAVSKYGGIPPYRETQNYIQKVMSLYNLFCGAR